VVAVVPEEQAVTISIIAKMVKIRVRLRVFIISPLSMQRYLVNSRMGYKDDIMDVIYNIVKVCYSVQQQWNSGIGRCTILLSDRKSLV
jgi:hypothetical protein